MGKGGWPIILRIGLMFIGLFWLIGLFLPSRDYDALTLSSGLTSEKIYTSLTDTASLSNLFTGNRGRQVVTKNAINKDIQFRLVKSYPFQYIAFQFQPQTLSIEKLEGEIQLSPDETGNKVELRCRITIGNHPVDKWKYWISQWRFEGWLIQVKTKLEEMLRV